MKTLLATITALVLFATFACDGDDVPAVSETPDASSVEPRPQLKSFHYLVELKQSWGDDERGGAIFEGHFVAPDRHKWIRDELQENPENERGFIIGTDAWIRSDDDEEWIATNTRYTGQVDPGDFTSPDEDFFAWDAGLVDALSTFDSQVERKNGVESRRYRFNKEELKRLVVQLKPGSFLSETSVDEIDDWDEVALTFWVAIDENVLISADIRFIATVRGSDESSLEIADGYKVLSHLTLNLTRVNDDDIRIDPPI